MDNDDNDNNNDSTNYYYIMCILYPLAKQRRARSTSSAPPGAEKFGNFPSAGGNLHPLEVGIGSGRTPESSLCRLRDSSACDRGSGSWAGARRFCSANRPPRSDKRRESPPRFLRFALRGWLLGFSCPTAFALWPSPLSGKPSILRRELLLARCQVQNCPSGAAGQTLWGE